MVDSARNNGFGLRRASFILRCWIDASGEIRARLIDVRSGVGYPLNCLSDLPGLIRQLVFRQPSAPGGKVRGGDTHS
jgi:hypothetical protein